MEYAPCAPEEVERDLELGFVALPKPDRTARMLGNLQRLSDAIGGEYPSLSHPPKGFLREPLSPAQLRGLNEELSFGYARRNQLQQQDLIHVPIVERNEPMQSLREAITQNDAHATFSETKFHHACGIWANQDRVFYARRSVARKFAQVCKGLNEIELMPHVEDAWRARQVQKGLFVRRLITTARSYPDWDPEDVVMIARSFTAPSPGLAGHQAGEAIDWQLRSMREQRDLMELGNDYPEGGVQSSIDFPYITERQWETRTYFEAVARMAGFKLLRTENWHISHGGRGMGLDGHVTMLSAQYGPLRAFDQTTGEVDPYQTEAVDVEYVSKESCFSLIEMCREREAGRGKFKVDLDTLYRMHFDTEEAPR